MRCQFGHAAGHRVSPGLCEAFGFVGLSGMGDAACSRVVCGLHVEVGTPISTALAGPRRSFRTVLKRAGLDPKNWTPREMRHSFVSLLSDSGMPIEAISRLVGHHNTSVTETVYLKQLRPVLLEGAEAMDRIFDRGQ
ncbi:tyrosine-type recombinase/integrase [Nonomuraea sp. NPDC049725]|uniref:tyrosine-type recombinase/integrase n=1 Tax=Nonomuraea sp. NPDC049725 TaxID=3154508 RepID=UPI00341688CE